MTILDPTSFTTLSSLMGLASSSPNRTLLRGRVGQTKEFTAIVATDAVHMNRDIRNMLDGNFTAIQNTEDRAAVEAINPTLSGDERTEHQAAVMVHYGKKEGLWMCSAMIVGDQSGKPFHAVNNTHNFLPGCRNTYVEAETAHMLIKIMIPAESVENLGMLPTEGDKIRIAAEYDRYGRLNLERGVYLGMVTKRQWGRHGSSGTGPGDSINVDRANCEEAILAELFNGAYNYESDGVLATEYDASDPSSGTAGTPLGRTAADEAASEDSYWVRSAEERSTTEPSAVPAAVAAAATEPQNVGAEILEIGHNGTLVWPWYPHSSPHKSLTVVVFFHGLKRGESDSYYQRAMIEAGSTSCGGDACDDAGPNGLITAFNELGKTLEDTLFVIPRGYDPSKSSWMSDIQDLKSEEHITITKMILGAHSAGSRGAWKALGDWDRTDRNPPAPESVYWADPEPDGVKGAYGAPTASGAEVTRYHEPDENNVLYYRPANWGSPLPTYYSTKIDPAVRGVASAPGAVVELVSQGHFEILKTTFKVIGQRSDIT